MKEKLEKYFDRLWPINRSLTGNGNRETLKILSEIADIKVTEIPSGTKCFDWEVPPEWNANEAWIKHSNGKKVIDFRENNLHLLGYSEKYSGKLDLEELDKHLYSNPKQPDVIPYLTSYYRKRWGFCLSENLRKNLDRGEYEVHIDSEINPNGSMTIGEAVLKGSTDKEILLSTYICHPSMANNELSGPLVTAFVYNELKKKSDRRYTYRFLFMPETIGAIYYLSVNGEKLRERLKAGYVVTCVGDSGKFTYKRSREGNTPADRAAEYVLSNSSDEYIIENFFPTGSDERQYCSPGFNLPVGSLMRTRYGKYREYHTSADNKDFISFIAMEETIRIYLKILTVLEKNRKYKNKFPNCEPQLGKRDLYPTIGSKTDTAKTVESYMWILNYSDGNNDLLSIADKSGIDMEILSVSAEKLLDKELIEIYE